MLRLSPKGRAFNKPPGVGSVSAQVRSIAARNEVLGLPPVAGEAPVFVTKDDAREAQRAESQVYGGQIPRRGMAASMQVSEAGMCAAMVELQHSNWLCAECSG